MTIKNEVENHRQSLISDIPNYLIQYLIEREINLYELIEKSSLHMKDETQYNLKVIDIAAFIDDYIKHETSINELRNDYERIKKMIFDFEEITLNNALKVIDESFSSIQEEKIKLMKSIKYHSHFEEVFGKSISPIHFITKKEPMAISEAIYRDKETLIAFLDDTKKSLSDLHSLGYWEDWTVPLGTAHTIISIYRQYNRHYKIIFTSLEDIEEKREYVIVELNNYINKITNVDNDMIEMLSQRFNIENNHLLNSRCKEIQTLIAKINGKS